MKGHDNFNKHPLFFTLHAIDGMQNGKLHELQMQQKSLSL